MSYVWFQDVLAALGKRINFESVSNLYGRTVFDKKSGDAISKSILKANPLTKENVSNSAAAFLSMPGTLRTVDLKQKDAVKQSMGDISWFEEFLK